MRVKEVESMKKKWICLLTALALAVGVCVAEPMASGAAALELTPGSCAMTIYPRDTRTADLFEGDLDDLDIVLDLYKVADAVKRPGYDIYSYRFDPNGLYKDLSVSAEPTAEEWRSLAQSAGKIALTPAADGTGAPQDSPEEAGVGIKEKIEGLDPGLYLVIARNSGVTDIDRYKIAIQGSDNIATIANSDEYTYIFSPELISVPMRGEDGTLDVSSNSPTGEDGPMTGMSEAHHTYDPDRWVYDVNVYLKPVRVKRYGSLVIGKKLRVYESEEEVLNEADKPAGQNEKVTFVFRAEWTQKDENGNDVPGSRVGSITFDSATDREKKILIDRIPIGTDITVTEIYSGASYREEGGAYTRNVRVAGADIYKGVAVLDETGRVTTVISELENPVEELEPSVSFTNTYDGRQKKGFGIDNEFEYDENGNWKWIKDGADTGERFHYDYAGQGGQGAQESPGTP